MSQEVVYTKITELEPISGATLKPNDTFMISRPTTGSNYVSYKCDYGQLSSAFVSSVVDALSVSGVDISAMRTVQDREDLKPDGNRLVSEKVVWYISQDAKSGTTQDGALLKKIATQQTVEGPVMFTGKLQCGNSDIAAPKDVVNYVALSNYVATAGMMPFFQGCAAESHTTLIPPDSKNDLYGILHKIYDDCIAQVILYSTEAYKNFSIFAYCMTCQSDHTADAVYSVAKAEIDSGSLDPENYCILQYVPLAANTPVVVNLPMRKENILCFLPHGQYSASTGLFQPKSGVKIKKNKLTITVREYKSFVEG